MSHALSDILADRFEEEPEEIVIIKSYVLDNLDQTVAVAIRDQQLIITTRSAAVAGALRPHLFKLKKLCGTDKRLVIRIGH
ncbi:MAG: hypothetical protein ABIQ89_01285 [Candidatus Saccharimonadales bacterium]